MHPPDAQVGTRNEQIIPTNDGEAGASTSKSMSIVDVESDMWHCIVGICRE